MATWNHRVVRVRSPNGTERYDIREVFYREDGAICGMDDSGIAPYGETAAELRKDIDDMLRAFDLPVLDDDGEFTSNTF